MKNRFKIANAIATLLTSALVTSVYATGNQDQRAVYAAAIDGCAIVGQIILDNKAADAYRKIKSLETKMDSLHQPLEGVEETLEAYGIELQQITELAIQDNEQTLYIDKELLREQVAIAEKMADLVALHQADFDAVSEFGNEVSKHAEDFSAPIEAAFDGLEYDRVNLFFEDEPALPEHCGDANNT